MFWVDVVGKILEACYLPTNCLSVFGHFVGLALKVLIGEVDEVSQSKKKLRYQIC